MKTGVIIVAGGKGTRIGGEIKKQYLKIRGKEILAHTIERFESMEEIAEIVLVVGADDTDYVREEICRRYNYQKVSQVVVGGKERKDSVWNGLGALSVDTAYVIVHDGARPFVSIGCIRDCLNKAIEVGASIVAVPVKDTIKEVNKEGKVEATPDREMLWAVQTPQAFEKKVLVAAHLNGQKLELQATDDSMLVEALGHTVWVVEGDYTNIKITTPEDLVIGELFVEK